MLRRATIVLSVLCVVFCSVGLASATSYSFVALSSAVSDTRSYGYALSLVNGVPEAGGKCGSSSSLNLGTPTIWNSAGSGNQHPWHISGAARRGVRAIDGNGDVAGMLANSSSNKQAFYLAAGGTSAAALPFLNTGDAYAWATGVNTAGQVVGLSGPATHWQGVRSGRRRVAYGEPPLFRISAACLRSGQRHQQRRRSGWLVLQRLRR